MQVTKFNLVTDLQIMISNVTHSNFYFECNKERSPIDQLYIELGKKPQKFLPLTPDQHLVKKPPSLLQITPKFPVFYGLSQSTTLKKKDLVFLGQDQMGPALTLVFGIRIVQFLLQVPILLYRGHS